MSTYEGYQTVEVLFHDSAQPARIANVKVVVLGAAWVSLHTLSAVYHYPAVNVQRVKEITP